MKITILPSDKGDCLLITANDGTTILVDGGMPTSYLKSVRPFLAQWAADNAVGGAPKPIDLVYVSHIDQDHIAGVLQLMDDLVAWRVYRARKNDGWKKPAFPEPPTPKAIWHNAFHDQVGKNAGEIESMLAASAARLSNSGSPALRELATEYREIATSIPEAIRLSRRVSPEQLGIPLNAPFGKKLAMVRSSGKSIQLGSLKVSVIGPFKEDLDTLRRDWNEWLSVAKNKKRVEEMRDDAREDERLLDTAGTPIAMDVDDELGNRKNVTAPNLASLMLLVEEGGKRVVLTGDGHHREISRGLEHLGVMPGNGGNGAVTAGAHVDVLKVPHHGSEHNTDSTFARRLTADHYVFCGNGKHENPDLRVVQIIAESRIGPAARLSPNPQVNQPFTFWFSSSPTSPGAAPAHMAEIEKMVRKYKQKSGGQLRYSFLTGKSLDLKLGA